MSQTPGGTRNHSSLISPPRPQSTPRTPYTPSARARSTPRASSVPRRSSSRAPSAIPPTDAPPVWVGVVENSRREVGIAIMSPSRPVVLLSQVPDNALYSATLSLLASTNPSELILCDTAQESKLHTSLRAGLPSAKQIVIKRSYFNENNGRAALSTAAAQMSSVEASQNKTPGSSLQEILATERYLAHAAANAVIKYGEWYSGTIWPAGSLRIEYMGLEGRLWLEASTVASLELVVNAVNGSDQGSLYGFINHTHTPGGARTLRAAVVCPLTDAETLKLRQECISELLNNETLFYELSTSLAQVGDIDAVLATLMSVHKDTQASIRASKARITAVLELRTLLAITQPLHSALVHSSSPLLTAIGDNLADPRFPEIANLIGTIIDDTVPAPTTRTGPAAQSTIAAAVRQGLNGLLDVARRTFNETLEDMNSLVESYTSTLGISSMKLAWAAKRGYHLTFSTPQLPLLPDTGEFIQLVKGPKRCSVTSEVLASLSSRNSDSLADIYHATSRVLDELLHNIRESIGPLYKLGESLSLLDMLWSLASTVSSSSSELPWTPPVFTPSGPIALEGARHPVAEAKLLASGLVAVPNSIMVPDSSLQLLFGSNGSGKSTYLRTLGLIVVMAQIGGWVPASKASLPITSGIWTRFSSGDDGGSNLSTFAVEMEDVSRALASAKKGSLVLLDEMGRGTSTIEGTAIAWAVAEALAGSGASTVLATHFRPLDRLRSMYPSFFSSIHVDADHLVQTGPGPAPRDSTFKAALDAGIPLSVVREAKTIAEEVASTELATGLEP